jgi:hypothetical protein
MSSTGQPPNGQPPQWMLMEYRIRTGLCPCCGSILYEVDQTTNQMTPLTTENVVFKGRCLYCYPPKQHEEQTQRAGIQIKLEQQEELIPKNEVANNNAMPQICIHRNETNQSCGDDDKKPAAVEKISATTTITTTSINNDDDNDNDTTGSENGKMKETAMIPLNMKAAPIVTKKMYGKSKQFIPMKKSICNMKSADYRTRSGRTTKYVTHSSPVHHNNEITIKDDCGLIYYGTLISGSTNKGVVDVIATTKNSRTCTYVGEVMNGLLHGKGKQINQYGNMCDGMFENGAMHGYGKCHFKGGWIYEGEWNMDQRHGNGTHYHKRLNSTDNGSKKYEIYDGEWVNDKRDGKGKLIFEGGDVYDGEFKNDVMHGIGTYIFLDECKYVGQFKDNERSGYGKQVFSNGSVYEGEWKKNAHKGQGKFALADGTVYHGTFFNYGNFFGALNLPDGTVKIITKQNKIKVPMIV